MGIVFSSLASCFMFIGEMLSYLCLGLGELGSVIVHGIFGLIVGICDVLAACMCCCPVPFSDRPDRDGYTYTTLALSSSPVILSKSPQPPQYNSLLQVIEEKGKASSDEKKGKFTSSLPIVDKRAKKASDRKG